MPSALCYQANASVFNSIDLFDHRKMPPQHGNNNNSMTSFVGQLKNEESSGGSNGFGLPQAAGGSGRNGDEMNAILLGQMPQASVDEMLQKLKILKIDAR